jgi:uroporphyrinogen-III decarboxylase
MDEVLCGMMEDQDLVARALAHLAEVQGRYIRSILETGARPLIFESGASPPLLPPAFFSKIEAPALGRMFSICRASGDASPHCILGGNVAPVLSELLALEPGFLICPSETDQNLFVELAKNAPQVAVRVNMPVSALMTDDWEETRSAADAAHALARVLPRATVGTGVVPIDIRPDLILKLRDYIQNL